MGLETFPLFDAFQEEGACPFCRLAEKLEQSFMQEYLDELVMDAGYRGRIESSGLCARHLAQFYAGLDKLGLTLTLQSMLATVRRKTAILKSLGSAANASGEGVFQALRQKRAGRRVERDSLARFESYVSGRDCVACGSVVAGLERYAATTVQAFANDAAFRAVYEAAPGLCFPHLAMLMRAAREQLGREVFGAFSKVTIDKAERDLDRVEAGLERFVRAHDYRFSHESWESFASSVRDAINLFAGFPISPTKPASGSKAETANDSRANNG